MRYCSTKLLTLFAVLLFVFGTVNVAPIFGQVETGSINGTVTDQSGAVIPKAKVVVRNADTSATRESVTDERGIYNVSNLLPGQYVVTAEAPNLAKLERRVQVTVGSRTEVNLQLTVSAAAATVEVVAEGGVAVNTETATLGVIADAKVLESFPALTRNPYSFAATAPTASDSDPSGRGVGVAFNGLRSSSTNVLLDGTANNDEFTASVGQSVPMDSVQEYSVLTNNFGAEYGRAAAGVVNLTTRYGTNDIHGSLYEYNRVSALSSNGFYNNAYGNPKTRFTRNIFGGRVGGPVKKDKIFYFGNIEFNRVRSLTTNYQWIVDPATIAAADAATQAFYASYGTLRPGVRILDVQPAATFGVNPCSGSGQPLACPINAGTYDNTTTPFMDKTSYQVNGDSGAGTPQNQVQAVGRMDWNVNRNTTIYSRYALNKQTLLPGTVGTSIYAGFDTDEQVMQNNFMISMTHTFSPRMTSQSKIVFNRLSDLQPLGANGITPSLYVSPSTTTTAQGIGVMLPGYLPLSPGNGLPFGGPQNFLQFYQDFSWSKGRHTIRFGGSYDYQRDNRVFGAYETPVESFRTSGGAWNSTALKLFMNGQLAQFQGAIDPQGNYPCTQPIYPLYYQMLFGAANPVVQCINANQAFNYDTYAELPSGEITTPASQPVFSRSNRYHEFAFYGSDQWKISKRVTLTLGLRWEYFGVQHNKDPYKDSNFYLGSGGSIFEQIRNGSVMTTPNSPIGGLWAKDWNNFAPKLGFAYDVFGNGKTILRGGYSIAYERNFGNVTFNVIQNPPNYAVVSVVRGVDLASLPVLTDIMGPLAGTGITKAIPPTSLRAVNPNIRTSFAHLMSLTVEHEIKRNLILGVDYSGSFGEKLYDISNVNRPASGNNYLGDPCVDWYQYFSPGWNYPCVWDSSSFGWLLPSPFNTFATGSASQDYLPYFALGTWRDQSMRLNSQYSNINFRSDGGKSHYNALVVRTSAKNVANTGLTLGANYTWSHTMDRLSDTFSSSGNNYNLGYLDPFNAKVDYGNSYMDIRHRIAISAVWDVPFGKNANGWQKYAVAGWSIAPVITAETGSPFSVYDCSWGFSVCPYAVNASGTMMPRTGSAVEIPGTALNPTPDFYRYLDFFTSYDTLGNSTGTPYFDNTYSNGLWSQYWLGGATNYYNPITGTSDFGPFPARMNARNAFRGPGQWNFDLAVQKSFKFRERFELILRGEAYNILNHANLYIQGGDTDIASYGFVDAYKSGRRHMQLNIRLSF